MADPKPHTPEWFKALEAFDQAQARHAKKIVELAGRADVCTICGDDPASDYRLVHPTPARGSVATIRLCDDCRMIRENGGESYLPLG